jgi:quinoprotein glucose dehydrogenase
MRSNYLFKSKIIKYFKIVILILVLFFLIDLTKIKTNYSNLGFFSFDSRYLSSSWNKKIYYFYDILIERILLLSSKHKNFWTVENDDRYKIETKNYTIPASSLDSIQISKYEKLLGDWKRSHGNDYSNRFSNLKNINKQNISNLKLAWIYHSNKKKGKKIDIQCNPIAVNGIIYTPIIGGYIAAIDGFDGKELWRSEQFNYDVARRGLLYWKDTVTKKERIFFNNGSKLVSLNIEDGKKDLSFGDSGEIRTGYTKITPLIFGDKIIVASWDKNLEVYDISDGKLYWKYFFGDNKRNRSGGKKYNNLKGGNPWGGISLDKKRGIVFITTGNPSNYFDGTQRPGLNYNSNSIIAISLKDKKQLWSFQETFHDIWNFDLPAPPILTSIKKGDKFYDVVLAVTKRGNTLILDRVSGKPAFDLNYKLAPKSDVAGERTYLYQLDLKVPEPFSKSIFSEEEITNINKVAETSIRKEIKDSKFGFFEPASFNHNTILFNFHGGAEWMGASVDHKTQTMYVNSNEISWIAKLNKSNNRTISGFKRLKDDDGYPGNKPPWGKITSLDLNTGKINWSIPFGYYQSLKDKGLKINTGTENFGGITATESGLIFATGTLDSMFYVFDSHDGRELYRYKLPFIGSSPPTTYISKNEQFVIVQSTGSHSLNKGYPELNKFGDAIVAFKIN